MAVAQLAYCTVPQFRNSYWLIRPYMVAFLSQMLSPAKGSLGVQDLGFGLAAGPAGFFLSLPTMPGW